MPAMTRRDALLSAAATIGLTTTARAGRELSMHTAATAFLAGLSAEQRSRAQVPFDDGERMNWHYVPIERRGLSCADMSAEQQASARRLLATGLSAKGISRADTIRSLENVLREMEQGKGPRRDPERYFFMVFGDPAQTGAWGWRYEGHHVSLNFTVLDGRLIASTPQFLGANPAEVRGGPLKGTRVLGPTEDLARDFLASLDERQRAACITAEVAPPDIVTGAARRAGIQQQQGLAWRDLAVAQQAMLRGLIDEHASIQKAATAKARLSAIWSAGLAEVRFAWMGSPERGQGHYYRIQGPTFLIEYDNTQDGANHIHTVWREFQGDWGADVLARHYGPGGHHAG